MVQQVVEIRDLYQNPRYLAKKITTSTGFPVTAVTTGQRHSVSSERPIASSRLKSLLADPVLRSFGVEGTRSQLKAPENYDWVIEIRNKPGVTDNLGHTVHELISKSYQHPRQHENDQVFSSRLFYISGPSLNQESIQKIADELHNPLIEIAIIKSKSDFERDGGMGENFPQVVLNFDPNKAVQTVDILNASDEELILIGKKGIALDGAIGPDADRQGTLALDINQMHTIREHFRTLERNPTDVELESIAQTWSEHCRHTIFASPIDDVEEGLFKHYIKGATDKIRAAKGDKDNCISIFKDNAGAIDFDENFGICHKVETHNSPSALDPFGGAITGIVGVNRDEMGMGLGALPVANTYGYCFGHPNDIRPLYKGPDYTQKMLSPTRIMRGVIEGVNQGGNQSGIPTNLGMMRFDERYRGKPLVFVGTLGLLPKKINDKPGHEKAAKPGDLIVMVGGKVGADGIHGATFSSEAMNPNSPATAVQIGDPITQKKMSDALMEARDRGLFNSITDNGAGGLSCSVAEMAKESGGCKVDLEKVPLKYPGLKPWEIWISESQERMTLAISPDKWQEFSQLMKDRDVEATSIGTFNSSGSCEVNYNEQQIMNLDLDFLQDGWPRLQFKTEKPATVKEDQDLETARIPAEMMQDALLEIISRPNLASNEFISRQYDHEVQGGSVLKPLQGKGQVNGDASIFRPRLDSDKGVVLSSGFNPSYSDVDCYHMAACAIDTAVRGAVAAGVRREDIALLDNFCWYKGKDPQSLYKLKEAARACYEKAVAYGTPFVSGKDSMFNDFKGYDENGNSTEISIPPSLLVSSFAVMPDVKKSVSMDTKFPGDLVYVLGDTYDELGGTEFVQMIKDRSEGTIPTNFAVPKVDAEKNKKLYDLYYDCVDKDLVTSSASVSIGGLATTLLKKSMAGKLGLDVSLKKLNGDTSNNASALFSESQGRMVVTIDPNKKEAFEKIMGERASLIGTVTEKPEIKISGKSGEPLCQIGVDEALTKYKGTFKDF